jgi:hypothetical protein
MKKNYNLDELENFLSDSAEQHRMYPSDRVWRNIDQELHGSKKWPALTFGAILTGAIITAGLILIHPDKTLFTVNTPAQSSEKIAAVNQPSNDGLLSPDLESSAELTISEKNNEAKSAKNIPFYADNDLIPENRLPITLPSPKEIEEKTETSNTVIGENVNDDVKLNTGIQSEVVHKDADLPVSGFRPFNSLTQSITDNSGILEAKTKAELFVPDLKDNESLYKTARQSNEKIIRPTGKNKNRWSLLFYATPSISYRYLSEAKVVDLHLQNGPIAPNLTHGVNNFVSHKPITGYEIGAAVRYDLNPALRVKTGLQFNLRGYNIEAYASKREISTILLNRGYYTDSLIGVSSISAQDGYRPMEISNRYLEISLPVGIDMRVVNWKKIQLFVAAGIQPTYQFNQSMYMISSDYKNYVQEPDLVRHWNVNTSLEAFMSYKAGGVTWQVGPQIRYQLLPGAIRQYPVRERLIDYGLKIGVVKTLK